MGKVVRLLVCHDPWPATSAECCLGMGFSSHRVIRGEGVMACQTGPEFVEAEAAWAGKTGKAGCWPNPMTHSYRIDRGSFLDVYQRQ